MTRISDWFARTSVTTTLLMVFIIVSVSAAVVLRTM